MRSLRCLSGNSLRKNCLLLLWSTGAMMPQALDVMRGWGFAYKSQMMWRKVTPAGKVRMGTGYWARTMHEPILIGSIGKPPKFSAFPSVFDGVAREHSRKPEEFYALVHKHTAGLRRADVFARTKRSGWDAFGNEVDRFAKQEGA
jgi:N6-adenosine-specific RNA methylase IME4